MVNLEGKSSKPGNRRNRPAFEQCPERGHRAAELAPAPVDNADRAEQAGRAQGHRHQAALVQFGFQAAAGQQASSKRGAVVAQYGIGTKRASAA
jgi:hypothetical protein